MAADDAVAAMVCTRQQSITDGASHKKCNVNLDKIKTGSKLQELRLAHTNLKDLLEKKLKTCADKLQPVADDGASPNMVAANDSLTEGKKLYATAMQFFDTDVEEAITECKDIIDSSNTEEDITRARNKMVEIKKMQTFGPIANFNAWSKKVNMTFVGLRRKLGGSAEERRITESAERPKHPMFAALVDGITEKKINITASVFEAKAGVRACVLKVSGEAVWNQLMKQSALKRSTYYQYLSILINTYQSILINT